MYSKKVYSYHTNKWGKWNNIKQTIKKKARKEKKEWKLMEQMKNNKIVDVNQIYNDIKWK